MSSDYIIREFVKPINVYVSYMTLYDFQEIFSTAKENERYTVFRLSIFLYDPCMISWEIIYDPCMTTRKPYKSYMTLHEY